jgi:hypothetical protein
MEINGEKIELVNEPRHGIVRQLRLRRRKMLAKILNTKDIKPEMSIEEAISTLIEKDPEKMMEFAAMQEEFNLFATICLATNRMWEMEDFDNLSESEFWHLYERCKDALGGTAEDFFEKYESSISLKVRENL